jgi:RHS repeat-associated protein
MIQPGRKYSVDSYRYGFNGKENDNEVKGEGIQLDYGFRIYDTRLGKFLSVDPLTGGYPYYTPYQFAGNMPITAIDLDGLEQYVVTYYKDQNNKTTEIQVRAVMDMKGAVLNQHVHKVNETEDIAKGNVLVFEVKKEKDGKESMQIVDKRNIAKSNLTKTEQAIFNRYKEPEPKTGEIEYLTYPDEEPNNLYDSKDFENNKTITYSANYIIPKNHLIL